MKIFDLYLDESGDFVEQNLNCPNSNPSQLAGLLVPRGQLSKKEALKIFRHCFAQTGKTLNGKEIHGCNMSAGANYDRLITALIGEIHKRNWQAVRLVNQAGVYFGGYTDYTNAIAELALKIFVEQSKQTTADIVLNFYCAERDTRENISELYLQTIKNYIAFASARRDLSTKCSRWRIGNLNIISAKKSRQLQICDLLSNSSYGEYQKCGDDAKNSLRQAFGNYDYAMALDREIEQCVPFADSDLLGLAMKVLAEESNRHSVTTTTKFNAFDRLDAILLRLVNLSFAERDTQLRFLIVWLEQLIELGSFELGIKIIQWLQKYIDLPLRDRLARQEINSVATLDWFGYTLDYWLLVVNNYLGRSLDSQKTANRLKKLLPAVARDWEHNQLVMSAFIADGIHQNECLEFDTAAARFRLVVNYFHKSTLFDRTFSEVFSLPVRSRLANKALAAWMQNEMYAAGFDPARLDRARGLSKYLVDDGLEDRFYNLNRCQLETVTGDFITARKYLAHSLNLDDTSHEAIAIQIKELTARDRGWTILHWLRLGTTAYLSGNRSEWSEFLSVLKRSGLLNDSWCRGTESNYYPTHGILRRVALIELSQGKNRNVALGKLRSLQGTQVNLVSSIVCCAAMAEAAGLLWEYNKVRAKRILNCSESRRLGLRQLLQILANNSNTFPQVYQLTQSWLQVVETVLNNGENARDELLSLGKQIGY